MITKRGLVFYAWGKGIYIGRRIYASIKAEVPIGITGATGSGALASTNSGLISTINGNGTYTAATPDSLDHWHASLSGGSDGMLTTLTGGQPFDLIVGPDSAGGFAHAGNYGNANPSILNHEPVVLGTATFIPVMPGVTAAGQISDVEFTFGTQNDEGLVVGQLVTSPVPEPSTTALLLAPLGYLALRRFRKVS